MNSYKQLAGFYLIISFYALALLQGCAGIQPKGTDQYIAVLSAEVKTAYQAIGEAHRAQHISTEDANKLLDRVDVAALAVVTANDAYNAGENAVGAGQLARVQAILEIVRAALPPPEAT